MKRENLPKANAIAHSIYLLADMQLVLEKPIESTVFVITNNEFAAQISPTEEFLKEIQRAINAEMQRLVKELSAL